MQAEQVARALVPVPGQGRYVQRRFWAKVRRTLGRVPFLDQAIAAWYAATDPATPRRARLMLMAALAYFVMPVDVVPDVLAAVGFTDDAAVLMMAIQILAPHIKRSHVERAQAYLAGADEPEVGKPAAV